MAGEPYPLFLEDISKEILELEECAPLDPAQIDRLFLLLLRAHWSSDNHGPRLTEQLSCISWNPNPAVSSLVVDVMGSDDLRNKPHSIWFEVGNFRFKQVSFGSRSEASEDNATEYYTSPCSCQLVIAHEAPKKLTAKSMAWSTLCFLVGWKEAILESLGGQGTAAAFRPEILGSPVTKESPPDGRFRVDVGARLDINIAVATTIESHKLKLAAMAVNPKIQ